MLGCRKPQIPVSVQQPGNDQDGFFQLCHLAIQLVSPGLPSDHTARAFLATGNAETEAVSPIPAAGLCGLLCVAVTELNYPEFLGLGNL